MWIMYTKENLWRDWSKDVLQSYYDCNTFWLLKDILATSLGYFMPTY